MIQTVTKNISRKVGNYSTHGIQFIFVFVRFKYILNLNAGVEVLLH